MHYEKRFSKGTMSFISVKLRPERIFLLLPTDIIHALAGWVCRPFDLSEIPQRRSNL